MNKQVTFKVWRGDATGGKFVEYTTEISEGMVVLDAIHYVRRPVASRTRGAIGLNDENEGLC